jgi:hypothetical protein
MAAQLQDEGGQRHLLLGELNAYRADSPEHLGPGEFLAALPDDVLCLADAFSLHAYASRGRFAVATDPVGALEAALDARGGCARGAPIWVTEAGAGAPHPGDPRPAGGSDAQAGCLALAEQLLRWSGDPRVGAVLQYTFRDDPAFPVGVVDAQLAHAYPSYRLWLAWARARTAGEPPPRAQSACA